MFNKLTLSTLVLSLVAVLAACAPSVGVSAADQSAAGPITVGEVVAEEDGFIVLHRTNEDGSPVVPASIGHAQVSAGTNTDVVVPLDAGETLAAGETLIAMLHVDTNGNGVYEFGPGSTDVDTPATKDGSPVVTPFTVN